ncbi:MAG TPA: hypothetical protein VGE07_15985, partial [Herpetosiphonaceae bacterium]
MLHVRRFDNPDPQSPDGQAWERLVRANPASGAMQSLRWAEFKRVRGYRALHLGLERAGELIGGALFYVPEASHHATLFVAPEGPVLPWREPE